MGEQLVEVKARSYGRVCYDTPDGGYRFFEPGEVKRVPLSELQSLQYSNGGRVVLKNHLLINDMSALAALDMEDQEPEYFYTEEQVKNLLMNGTLEELEDCLNFAPNGVVEMVKNYAVSEEVPDMRKRGLITKMTGFNVNASIELNHKWDNEDADVAEATDKPVRKAAKPEAPVRKAAAPKSKYKTVE